MKLQQPDLVDRIVLVADLLGTAVFAAEGALVAMAARLDLLGIAVIAFVVALGGGLLRDMLLGATPPAALRGNGYLLVVLVSTLGAVALRSQLQGPMAGVLLVLDAGGLALFATAGTQKALDANLGAGAAAIIGTLTATGGGALRDVLLNHVPAVLRVDFYATAAFAGAVVIIAARRAGFSARTGAVTGGMVCFLLRLLGASLHWHLPVIN